MFPQLKLTPARAAFARPGPGCHSVPRRQRSYAALRLPRPLRPPLRSPLANGLPRCGELLLHRRTGAPANPCSAGDISTPAPRQPALSQGETRVSQVPGPSSSCVPWSKTPPGVTAPRPLSVRPPSSSGEVKPWTPGKTNHFVATYPRPTRSRAYASPSPLPSPAQGSLPARAGSPLAGRDSHPLDDKQGFMKSSHSSFLLDQPCLVALLPGFQVSGSPRIPAGYHYDAKLRIASAGLSPASTAASLAAPPSPSFAWRNNRPSLELPKIGIDTSRISP